jgi:basic membrane protein A
MMQLGMRGCLKPAAILLISTLALGACSGGSSGSGSGGSPAKGGLRLAMVTDVGGLGDKSFNDSAYAGLKKAKADLGADIEVLESKSAADYQPNLTVLADGGYDDIFAIGFLMNKDLAQVAKNHPQGHFAIVDAVVDLPNVTSITFREQDASFLAGALAARVSKTKMIGFLGGLDIPLLRKFEAGFSAGAHQVDPSVKVEVKYVGSFEDVASGKELASVLLNDHVDVIYVAAGKSGLGAIGAIRDTPNVYAIGVDSDQDDLAKGKILTSVLKRVDVAVFHVAQDAKNKKKPSGHLELGLKDDGVGLTEFQYTRAIIGAKTIAEVGRLRQAIIAGKITPPQTREELQNYKPVKL